MPPISELSFQRAMINLTDAGRLGEGEDLNDALLDFFIRLGQHLIPKGGYEKAPVSYLGSIFWKSLRGAFVNSGEEGWKNVQNWAKRKAGGLFKPSYAAFAVPINEDLKDDKGQDAGNHWWLAMVINPGGGALGQRTAVMCLDSMQRRENKFDPPLKSSLEGSLNRYTVEVTQIEQAGYLIIISFEAKGDGSYGPLQRPEKSRLLVDGYQCVNPQLGLRINMPGGDGTAGTFQGTLTFAMDGRSRSSVFELYYGEEGYSKITLQFDAFELTKLQKDVSRFLGGYMAKEWEMNGPNKGKRFEKQKARALVTDVHQQENLNDCGVFVLENTLRSLSMDPKFLLSLADASPEVLSSFPWPSQADVTTRKAKLKAIVARLFAAGAEKNTKDVETLLKDDTLKSEVLASLTDERGAELDQWSDKLHQELAKQQVEKDREKEIQMRKEEAVQAKKEEERLRKEEEARKAEEERLMGKNPPGKKKEQKKKERSRSRSDSSSRDRKKKKEKEKKAKGKKAARSPSGSSKDSRSESASRGRGKKKAPAKGKSKKKAASDSRSQSEDSRSRSRSRGRGRR